MRIDAYGHMAASAPLRARTRSSGMAFTIGGADEDDAGRCAAAGGTQQTVALGALLSLQSSGHDTVERRAAREGHSLLDDLSKLQSALLGGHELPELLMQLKGRLPELRFTGDVLLDPILREIDLRVRVELAKRGL